MGKVSTNISGIIMSSYYYLLFIEDVVAGTCMYNNTPVF